MEMAHASTTRSPRTSSICDCPSRARSAPRLWRPSPTGAQAATGREGCPPSPSAPSGTPTSAGTSSRRYAHISGEALDQYPPAVGRGEGKRLVRGRGPRGWEADVAYVPRSEQRDFDAVLTIKLRR